MLFRNWVLGTMLDFSKGVFPRGKFLRVIFPSFNFPNVQFLNRQLTKSVLAAAPGFLAHPSRSTRPSVVITACRGSEGLT